MPLAFTHPPRKTRPRLLAADDLRRFYIGKRLPSLDADPPVLIVTAAVSVVRTQRLSHDPSVPAAES
jgi:hypothetical protein